MTSFSPQKLFAGLSVLLGFGLLAGTPTRADAAIFTVTKTSDTNDGACNADCSLREAVVAANAAAGADTIAFAADLDGTPITLSRAGDDDTAVNGDLDVTGALTIQGNGAANTVIQAGTSATNGVDKVFSFNPLGAVNPGFAVTLNGITIQYGKNVNTSGDNRYGGAFDFDAGSSSGSGSLSVTDCVIKDNATVNGSGGGFQTFSGGAVSLLRTEISNNRANSSGTQAVSGGGIQVGNSSFASTFTLDKCIVSANSVPISNGLKMDGGGIYIFNNGGVSNYQINNSVISDNTASNDGGGIYSGEALAVSNSTINGNSTARNGAGLFISLTNGESLSMSNSTISGNAASGVGGGLYANAPASGTSILTTTNATITGNRATGGGGGLNVGASTGVFSVTPRNTIIAGNTISGTTASDVGGALVTASNSKNNLIGTGGSGGLISGSNGNLVGVDARLAALADNGGQKAGATGFLSPLKTHALLPGSPALDAGDSASASGLTTDERGAGYPRAVDGPDADAIAQVDIGAFEKGISLQDITDKAINEDTTLSTTVNFDGSSQAGGPTVTATSSNLAVVPNSGINVGGSGSNTLPNSPTLNPSLVITPAANAFGQTTITVTVSDTVDGTTQTATDTFVLTVAPVADAPSISTASTNEETQTTSGLVISRNAVDGAEVTHFKITGITNGTLFQADGTTPIANNDFITFAEGNAGLKFTPAADAFSTATTFGFTAAGATSAAGAGLGVGTAVTISVAPVADAPSISTASTSEDTQTTSGLVISRNAVDSAEVTHFRITGITNGTLFQADGTTQIANNDFITFAEGNAGLKFTPAANLFSPATSFGFIAAGATSSLGAGLGFGTAVTISVAPVADAPSISAASTNEDIQTTSGLVIARNAVDGVEVTHFKITGITNGTLFQADGTTPIANNDFITFAEGNAGLKFTPAADASNPATTFGFTAAGATSAAGAGLGVGTAVTISVASVNDAPTISPISNPAAIAQDAGTQTVNLAGISAGPANENGQTITVTASSNNTDLIPNPTVNYTSPDATGTLAFTPVAGEFGTATITVTVKDDGLKANNGVDTTTRTFVVAVVGTPTANSQAVDVLFNTETAITLTGTDPNDPALALTYTVTTNPVHGTLSGTGPNRNYTPDANYQGSDSFQFTVGNGTATSAPATVSISVAPGTPTANSQTVNVAFNTPEDITLTGTDPNDPALALTYTVTTNPTHGTLSGTGPNRNYTPNANYQGSDSLQFTVSNGTKTSAPATVTIAVAPGTPTANDQNVSVTQDVAKTITLSGTDPDDPALPLTFAIGVNPTHGTLTNFDAAAGTVSYTPAEGYFGSDSFEFTAGNGTNTSAPATVSITVVGKPTANAQTVVVAFNTPKEITLTGSDPNTPPRALTYAVTTNPTHGALSGTAPNLIYTPADGYFGADSFEFTASNNTVTSTAATVTISVAANTPPVAVADTATTDEDAFVDIEVVLNDTDAERANGALVVQLGSVANEQGGTATLLADKRTIRFTPAPNANSTATPGGFSFTYKASDGTDVSSDATVSITVTAQNDAPVATPVAAFTTPQNVAKTVTLAGTDIDGDTLDYVITSLPTLGTLYDGASAVQSISTVPYTLTDAQHRVTLRGAVAGTGSFGFKVDDRTASSAVQTVNYTISDANAPTITINVPADKAILNTLSSISGIAADNVGVVRVDLYLQRQSDTKFWDGTQWTAFVLPQSTLTTVLTPNASGVAWNRNTGLPTGLDLNSGPYFIAARAFDALGNATSATAIVNVDVVAPIAVIQTPEANAAISATPVINGFASDNQGGAGLDRVTIVLRRNSNGDYWNGTNWVGTTPVAFNATLAGNNWTRDGGLPVVATSDPTKKLTDGSYTVAVAAYDRAGNISTIPTRNFIVDTKQPLITISTPANAANVSALPSIAGTTRDVDNGSGVMRVDLYLQRLSDSKYWNGTAWSSATPLATTISGLNWNKSGGLPSGANLLPGNYFIAARAFDRANNALSATSTFRVVAPNAGATAVSPIALSTANAKSDGTIRLSFTGALGAGATDAANYAVTQNGAAREVQSVQQPAVSEVVITLDALNSGSRVAVTYDLKDTQGRIITGTSNVVVK